MTGVISEVTTGVRRTGARYWLANYASGQDLYCVVSNGKWSNTRNQCLGIRPVITLTDGVYIVSGSGTESSPYVLGKE